MIVQQDFEACVPAELTGSMDGRISIFHRFRQICAVLGQNREAPDMAFLSCNECSSRSVMGPVDVESGLLAYLLKLLVATLIACAP